MLGGIETRPAQSNAINGGVFLLRDGSRTRAGLGWGRMSGNNSRVEPVPDRLTTRAAGCSQDGRRTAARAQGDRPGPQARITRKSGLACHVLGPHPQS
jgi:hypothetical protein